MDADSQPEPGCSLPPLRREAPQQKKFLAERNLEAAFTGALGRKLAQSEAEIQDHRLNSTGIAGESDIRRGPQIISTAVVGGTRTDKNLRQGRTHIADS